MALNSVTFILFLAAVAVIYYQLPQKLRNAFLLAASYIFYIWAVPYYAAIIFFTTALTYFTTKFMERQTAQRHRRFFLVLGIIIPVLVLCVFKYYNFFTLPLAAALGIIPKPADVFSLIFPVGISFYTFQVIGYNIDVYNKKTGHERNFITYALFVSFFPQIIAGPIGRAGELLPQYKEKHNFHYAGVVQGMQRFLIGAFKKAVVADGLGIFVNGIYGNIREYKGLMLILAAVLYAVQIYCDFSGYSDMAIGAAKILGFRLRENFNQPYMATNISGFWQRWHMSLTSWLNDYIFTPLVWSRWYNKLFQGKKWDEHKPHVISNIIIVFLISGLWHGSTINFVIWGLLHGLFRAGEELIKRGKKKKKKKDGFVLRNFKRLGIFGVSALTHIFFRLPTLADVGYFFSSLASSGTLRLMRDQIRNLAANGIGYTKLYYLIFSGGLIIGIIIFSYIELCVYRSAKTGIANPNPLNKLSGKKRWAAYWLLALLTAMFYLIANTGQSGSGQFIYRGF